MSNSIPQEDKIIKIITMFYPKSKIYLFGSYARGDSTRSSDIDIAVDTGELIPIVPREQIKNMIEALNLVQKVDLVDFNAVPSELQHNILKEGHLLWRN
jgi:predicted nucleotidyltransferase